MKLKAIAFLVLVMIPLVLLAESCAPLRQAAAWFKSTDMFHPVGENVLVEADEDSAFAIQIQSVIPLFLDSVQYKLGLSFPEPVNVYVCHTTENFCKHTGSKHPGPRASVLKKFFVSPRLQGTPDWDSIVYHELVHVILWQHLSAYRYQSVPIWFHEGLATMISDGGGSGDVVDSTAIGNILAGKHFNPVDKENFIFPQSFENPEIGIWVHYRQAMLFVAYMKASSPQSFDALMQSLVSGGEFSDAVYDAYGKDVANLWEEFVSGLQKNSEQREAPVPEYSPVAFLTSFNFE